MTDRPTVMLNAYEWRGVTLTNLIQLHSFLNSKPAVVGEDVPAIDEHVERFRFFLRQWVAACAKEAAGAVAQPEAERPVVPAAAANGAAKPKGKGGWPKGRKRKPVQQEAVQ